MKQHELQPQSSRALAVFLQLAGRRMREGSAAHQHPKTRTSQHRQTPHKHKQHNKPQQPIQTNLQQRYTERDITSAGRFASAAAAGSVSALIGSPTELIIIQQQKNLTPLVTETKAFFSKYPAASIYRGLVRERQSGGDHARSGRGQKIVCLQSCRPSLPPSHAHTHTHPD